jgi:hypothetical protein
MSSTYQLRGGGRYYALSYMSVYTFLHSLVNVLIQIANKIGLQKMIEDCKWPLKFRKSYAWQVPKVPEKLSDGEKIKGQDLPL